MVDFAAEGLLDGLDGDARAAREALLARLHDDGCSLEELRRAVEEDRLVLLPVDRALDRDAKYTPLEMAERSGIDLGTLERMQAAFGLPLAGHDEKRYTDQDLAVIEGLRGLLDAGVPEQKIAEMSRVIGRAAAQVAASSRATVAEALFLPGQTESEVAELAAMAARELAPLMTPVLGYAYAQHLREVLRADVLSIADVAAGRVSAAQDRAIAFADLVDYTRLGEEIPAEELGAVAGRLEELAGDIVCAPVTLVKTVGDAVMLASPSPDRLIETGLDLLDAAAKEGRSFPQLRVGIAFGPALERAGDWFGSPVNTASRVTAVARAGSVLATADAREAAEEPWSWSFAGDRRLKGMGVKRLFRARRPKAESA